MAAERRATRMITSPALAGSVRGQVAAPAWLLEPCSSSASASPRALAIGPTVHDSSDCFDHPISPSARAQRRHLDPARAAVGGRCRAAPSSSPPRLCVCSRTTSHGRCSPCIRRQPRLRIGGSRHRIRQVTLVRADEGVATQGMIVSDDCVRLCSARAAWARSGLVMRLAGRLWRGHLRAARCRLGLCRRAGWRGWRRGGDHRR